MAELPFGTIRSVLDSRGQLVAVEHDLLPFRPARTFVVTSESAPVVRGGHPARCRELLVLIAGRAMVSAKAPDTPVSRVELCKPGDALLVAPDDHIDYWLEEPGSVLLVLADRPFDSRNVESD